MKSVTSVYVETLAFASWGFNPSGLFFITSLYFQEKPTRIVLLMYVKGVKFLNDHSAHMIHIFKEKEDSGKLL